MNKNTGRIILGVGALALCAWGLYRIYKLARGPLEKAAGHAVGATINFKHKGYAQTVWIGFGLGPGYGIGIRPGHQDPATMAPNRWIGGFFDIPAHDSLVTCSVEVEGIFPSDIAPGASVDANKVILPYPMDPSSDPITAEQYSRRLDDDWDDDVYTVIG